MPAKRLPFVLAIDLGTSSVRTALFDGEARRLPGTLAQRSHAVTYSDDGTADLAPEAVRANLDACLRATLARAGKREVAAVGMSCFWHGLMGVDARGKPITPISLPLRSQTQFSPDPFRRAFTFASTSTMPPPYNGGAGGSRNGLWANRNSLVGDETRTKYTGNIASYLASQAGASGSTRPET